jgi:hypothetical protein
MVYLSTQGGGKALGWEENSGMCKLISLFKFDDCLSVLEIRGG